MSVYSQRGLCHFLRSSLLNCRKDWTEVKPLLTYTAHLRKMEMEANVFSDEFDWKERIDAS